MRTVVCEQFGTSGGALVADLCIRGVRIPQAEVLFDIHMVDTDAQSYYDCSPMAVLSSAECNKKQKYSQACHNRRATFAPCVSVDGMFGCETNYSLLKRNGDMLSVKWEMEYGTVKGWVHAKLLFVILCATLLYVWGSCTIISGVYLA